MAGLALRPNLGPNPPPPPCAPAVGPLSQHQPQHQLPVVPGHQPSPSLPAAPPGLYAGNELTTFQRVIQWIFTIASGAGPLMRNNYVVSLTSPPPLHVGPPLFLLLCSLPIPSDAVKLLLLLLLCNNIHTAVQVH